MFLHNPVDFVVSWVFLLYPSLMAFLAVFVVLLLLFLLLWKFKVEDIPIQILWGVFIAAYIQTLFLNGNMVALTGATTEYSVRSFYNITNLLIWGVIISAPVVIWIITRVKKINYNYEKVLIFSVLIMTGMQITGLTVKAVTTELPNGFDEDTPVFSSYEPLSSFSKDKNIIVFILDKLDGMYMRETLETYPHLNEALDGFTFYENNISEYWVTFPSITSMLTGHYYREGQTYNEYFNEAWSKRGFVDILRENNFTTNLYLDITTTYQYHGQLFDKADNMKRAEAGGLNIKGFIDTVPRLSMGRMAPYLLKNRILATVLPDFANNMIDIPYWIQPLVVGNESDMKFYRYISDVDFNADSNKSVLNVMHMVCSHSSGSRTDRWGHGYHYDDETGIIDYGGNRIETTRACFELMLIYFEEMKKLGVYDNSTIILVADHGEGFIYEGVPDDSKNVEYWALGTTSSLLIKPAGAKGALLRDDSSELSHKYFGASILQSAELPHDELGNSYFDFIRGRDPLLRIKFGLEHWHTAWEEMGAEATLRYYGHYEVSGDARDPQNWNFIPS